MNVSKVGGISSNDPSKKKEKIAPDGSEFNKIMKIKKTGEVDPEEKSKRRKEKFELPEKEKKEVTPSPYKTEFYQQNIPTTTSKNKVLPLSSNEDLQSTSQVEQEQFESKQPGVSQSGSLQSRVEQQGLPQTDQSKTTQQQANRKQQENKSSTQKKAQEKEKTPEEKEKEQKKEEIIEKGSTIKKKEEKPKSVFWQKKENDKSLSKHKKIEEKAKITPYSAEKTKENLLSTTSRKGKPTHEVLSSSEKLKEQVETKNKKQTKETPKHTYLSTTKTEKETSLKVKEEKEEEKTTKTKERPPQLISINQIPQTIMQTATSVTPSYLPAQITPLFTHIVGTIVYITQKGISHTTVTLNSPSLIKSVFYDCKIVITQYSTAPNSFNITLVGNPKAVNIFQTHLPSLAKAFKESDLDFQVGKLDVEYETTSHLIRRKQSISGQKEGEEENPK